MKELVSEVAGGSEDSQPPKTNKPIVRTERLCNHPVRLLRKSTKVSCLAAKAPMKERWDLSTCASVCWKMFSGLLQLDRLQLTEVCCKPTGGVNTNTSHCPFFTVIYIHACHTLGSSLGPHSLIHACVIWCVWLLSLRQLHSLLLHFLSDHPVLSSARQLHLPRCGGQIPCATPLRHPGRERASHRLWAQRPLHHGGLCRVRPGVLDRATVPWRLRLRWRHHRQGALWCLPKTSRSLWRRRPIVLSVVVVRQSWQNGETCCLHIWLTSFERSRNSETQLRKWANKESSGKTKEQILADLQADIRKHEFQADYDRRSIQKLNGMIESQEGEISTCSSRRRTTWRDQQLLHEQLLEQNRELREAHEKSLSEMEELKRFPGSTFDRRKSVEDRDTILELTSKIQGTIREIFKMLNQHAVDNPTLPINQCFSHLIQILAEC